MDTLRGNNPIKINAKNDIIFQCLEWFGTNEMKQELNPDQITAREALSILYELKEKITGDCEPS